MTKTNPPIIGDDGEPIHDAVNTLIFTIASHFIGDSSLWKDRSAELLSNLWCKILSDFRWYKDTFLTRVYTREDSQQPFWKEKFLAGLPKSLGDKVRDKIRSLTPDGIIPYDELSYGQLISFIQKIEDQINNLLIESSDDDSGRESSDDINNIQIDDVESSSDSDVKQISVLSKDQDLLFDAIEAIDSNCIKEGLIPTKYIEKSTERLSSITGERLSINFKLTNVFVEKDFPELTSFVGGQVTFFEFLDSPKQRSLNLIESKTKQICFLKEEISFKTLESQLSQPKI
ncbi:uncharacterized protein DS421_13g393610 [Arachis hypogaea]|nr:uncharacterized protein DS421_13g393610 [Arachis hypogaea]